MQNFILSKIGQFFYNCLIYFKYDRFQSIINFILKYDDPEIKMKIGKKLLSMKLSHKLPFYQAFFPYYDRILPDLCYKLKEIEKKLILIDIGANIGDTISLITDVTSGSFLCIEGDEEYIPILKKNINLIKNSEILIEESYCSCDQNNVNNFFIERKNGTAKIFKESNNNKEKIKFNTLDDIITHYPLFKNANILKIDTDGFEINILKGSENFIKNAAPYIFFEFTPSLYLNNQQDPMMIFEILKIHNYRYAFIYDNFGIFIEKINISDIDKIKLLISKIDNNKIYYYDILIGHESKENILDNIVKS